MFSQLITSLGPHFAHPALVPLGAMMVASPIIIHLINRMRFRRVRFAAMEFLLASEQKNRRRLLLEQLLLLLLRILIVLGLLALIARLLLDPSQLSLFQGAKVHHVVLLDDSGSMRDRWGETSAFQEGLAVARKLAVDGAKRPGTERISLLLLSRPSEPLFTQEDVNDDFLTRLDTKLENLKGQATYQELDVIAGMEEARKLLADDRAAVKTLHVVSDFRVRDWVSQGTIEGELKGLEKAGINLNLVRTVPDTHGNLAITDLSGDVHVAAAGVPLRLRVAVKNYGKELAKDVRLAVFQDGQKLPMAIVFDKIDAGKEVDREFDIVFDVAQRHVIQLTLDPDSLDGDNARWLAVDVPPKNSVLIIDGDSSGEEAFFVAAALAPDVNITGYAPLVEGVDYLRRQPLTPFQSIYLINVPELAADAIEPLKDFVKSGGGLVWFAGDLVKPAFYNDKLYEEGKGLFPVPLAPSRRDLPANDGTNPGADFRFQADHPIFEKIFGEDNPFSDLVLVSTYLPVADSWPRDDNERKDGVRTIATLRNKQPVFFEHQYGKGKVITCLTSAAKGWNNWASGPGAPSFVTTQLEIEKYVARQDRAPERRTVGQPLDFALSPTEYVGQIEIRSPKMADIPVLLNATRGTDKPSDASKPGTDKNDTPATGSEPPARPLDANAPLRETFTETNAPGVYTVALLKQDDTKEERLYSYNVPVDEGNLEGASNDEIRKRAGEVRFDIQDAGSFQWIQGRELGDENGVRTKLLALLVILLLCEQALACRLSFHPKQLAAA